MAVALVRHTLVLLNGGIMGRHYSAALLLGVFIGLLLLTACAGQPGMTSNVNFSNPEATTSPYDSND